MGGLLQTSPRNTMAVVMPDHIRELTPVGIYSWDFATSITTSFTPVGNEADRVMAANVRPLTSRLTHPTHPPTFTPKPLLLLTWLGTVGNTSMTRRTIGLLVTLACLFVPLAAAAQTPRKAPRIGVLLPQSPPTAPDWKQRSLFLQELRHLGWREGENITVEYRWAGRGSWD
jgi:hypothetical protein